MARRQQNRPRLTPPPPAAFGGPVRKRNPAPGDRVRGGGLLGPPLGTYDPALNYKLRASRLGLKDLIEDTRTAEQRARGNFRTERGIANREYGRNVGDLGREREQGLEDYGREYGRGTEDLNTSFTRDLKELAIARQRGEEDYGRTLGDMQRRYAALGQQQQGAAIAAGVGGQGTTAASSAVRGANQTLDKSDIDLRQARLRADLNEQEGYVRGDFGTESGRLNEDFGRETGRLEEEFGITSGRLDKDFLLSNKLRKRDFKQGQFDLREKVSRAKRNQLLFEPTAIEQMYYQARQGDPSIRFPKPMGAGGVSSPGNRRRPQQSRPNRPGPAPGAPPAFGGKRRRRR